MSFIEFLKEYKCNEIEAELLADYFAFMRITKIKKMLEKDVNTYVIFYAK